MFSCLIQALARLCEGIRLYRQQAGSKLVCYDHSTSGRITQAEILPQTAVVLGVSPHDTLLSPTPAHTEAYAYPYTARFGNQYPFILVTDAIHNTSGTILVPAGWSVAHSGAHQSLCQTRPDKVLL